jgi:hypothetical protein
MASKILKNKKEGMSLFSLSPLVYVMSRDGPSFKNK